MGTCSQCQLWNYTSFTEKEYGMGVGVCLADGSQTFCDHPCPLCVPEDERSEMGSVDLV